MRTRSFANRLRLAALALAAATYIAPSTPVRADEGEDAVKDGKLESVNGVFVCDCTENKTECKCVVREE